jgi:hypothetical protein
MCRFLFPFLWVFFGFRTIIISNLAASYPFPITRLSASNPSNQGSSVVIIIASATHRHHNSHPHTRHLTKRREFSFVSLHCTNTSASSYSILLRCAPFSPCLIISGSALQRLFALCATVFAFDLGCCRWVYLPFLVLWVFRRSGPESALPGSRLANHACLFVSPPSASLSSPFPFPLQSAFDATSNLAISLPR